MASPENPQFEPQPALATQEPARLAEVPGDHAALQPEAIPQKKLSEVPVVPGSSGYSPAPPPSLVRPEDPVWSGWDVLLIVGLALATIFISQLGILFGAQALFYPHASLADLAQKPILLLVSQFIIDGAVAIFLFLLVEGKYHVRFWQAIRWNWPRSEWKMLGLGVVMLFGLTVLENLLPMPKDTPFDKLFERPRDAYLLAVIAVSLGPLVEELFFRGFLYPVIARRWGVLWGILLTALPFALMHLPQYGYAWGAMVVILIVGIVCGAVRAATKSVGASFLVHVGYNGTQMLIAVIATQGFRHMPKALTLLSR